MEITQEQLSTMKRTVVFRVKKYRPVHNSDFDQHLMPLLAAEDVVALGTVGGNHNWHLTVTRNRIVNNVLAAGDFFIDDMPVKVSCLEQSKFVARIHGCPFYVPMESIEKEMSKYGHVLLAKFEKSTKSHWPRALSQIRCIVVKGDRDNIPHRMEFDFGESKIDVLITITGRAPVCLICDLPGHIRRECGVPSLIQGTKVGQSDTSEANALIPHVRAHTVFNQVRANQDFDKIGHNFKNIVAIARLLKVCTDLCQVKKNQDRKQINTRRTVSKRKSDTPLGDDDLRFKIKILRSNRY